MPLSESTKATIKSTIPVLQARGTEVIQSFYTTLFNRYPSVRPQFNVDRQSPVNGVPAQVSALARAVLLFAQRVDDLDELVPQLRPIAEKHVSRGVKAPQYDAVGECLLVSLREVLDVGEAVLAAWGEGFGVLKEVFVGMEEEVRVVNEGRAGWAGMKEVVVRGSEVCDRGRVVRLEVGLGECYVGMFVSVVVKVDGEETMTSVSVVDVHDGGISIKVEENGERSMGELMKLKKGDRLSMSVPCGLVK